jgi:hypothetical protein
MAQQLELPDVAPERHALARSCRRKLQVSNISEPAWHPVETAWARHLPRPCLLLVQGRDAGTAQQDSCGDARSLAGTET